MRRESVVTRSSRLQKAIELSEEAIELSEEASMNIGDHDFERAMAAIERLVAVVGPRRPTITKKTGATRRERAILDVIATYSHGERKQQGD
jgi:hypothetical protein